MADVSIIREGNTYYNVKDAVGREALAVVENKGAKNILKTYDIPETTSGNVVFSIIDGVCSVSTTATQTTAKVLVYAMDADVGNTSVDSRYTIPRGTYILKTTGNGKVKLRAIEHDGTNTNRLAETTGADAEFTYSGTMPYVVFTLSVSSNTSLSEAVTFIPMCCLKAEYVIDQTAVKYGKTNAELTLLEKQDRDGLATAIDKGAKNVADMSKSSFTTNEKDGVTVTLSGDTITSTGTSGTSINQFHRILYNGDDLLIPPGTWVAALIGTGTDTFRIEVFATGYADLVKGTYGSTVEFTIPDNATTSYLRITQKPSTNCTGTFKLLITTKEEWDISQAYVPYGKTNAELTNDTSTLFTENTRQETEIGAVANAGAKNILEITTTSQKVSDVDFTINSDGTIDLNGTASANNYLTIGTVSGLSGDYILTGCPSGGGNGSYRLYREGSSSSQSDTGSGYTYSFSPTDAYAIRIYIYSGYQFSHLVFRPMLRPAAITDPTFQPYARTNRDLTVLTDEDRASLVEIVDGGAKNALNFDKVGASGSYSTSFLTNGVRFTVNADGTITVNREATSTSNAVIALVLGESSVDVKPFCDGAHVLSGCPSGGSSSTYSLYVARGGYAKYDTGDGVILDSTTEPTVAVLIIVYSKYSPNNLIFAPMICTKVALQISKTYQPYRPNWQEMYERIVALEAQNT